MIENFVMMKKKIVEKIGSLEIAKHAINRKLREFANLRVFRAFASYVSSRLTCLRALVPYLSSGLTRLTRFTYEPYLPALRAIFAPLIYAPLYLIKSPIKSNFKRF